jgi:FixJ family two-component response regulator
MVDTRALIAVVDDNEAVRESLPDLLGVFGLSACTFSSAAEFLRSEEIGQVNCVILDIAMPGMSGPELLDELRRIGMTTPVIFITALKDETVRARMLERGAVDCLFKPFSNTDLLLSLNSALR